MRRVFAMTAWGFEIVSNWQWGNERVAAPGGPSTLRVGTAPGRDPTVAREGSRQGVPVSDLRSVQNFLSLLAPTVLRGSAGLQRSRVACGTQERPRVHSHTGV